MKSRIRTVLVAVALGLTVASGSAYASHPQPTTKADCREGSFAEYRTSGAPDAPQRFKSQGDCIQFVNTGK